LSISRSSYYYKEKEIVKDDIEVMHKIDKLHTDNSEYGYRQIYLQLQDIGVSIGRDRVLKYMGIMGIQAIYPHKKKKISIKDNEHQTYPYLLKEYWSKMGERTKSVEVKQANEVWSGDITYIRTAKEYINKYNFKRFHSSINNQQPMYYYLETINYRFGGNRLCLIFVLTFQSIIPILSIPLYITKLLSLLLS